MGTRKIRAFPGGSGWKVPLFDTSCPRFNREILVEKLPFRFSPIEPVFSGRFRLLRGPLVFSSSPVPIETENRVPIPGSIPVKMWPVIFTRLTLYYLYWGIWNFALDPNTDLQNVFLVRISGLYQNFTFRSHNLNRRSKFLYLIEISIYDQNWISKFWTCSFSPPNACIITANITSK